MSTPGREFAPPTNLRNRRFVTLLILVALGVGGWMPVLNFLSLFVREQLGSSLGGAAYLFLAMHGVTGTIGLLGGLWIRRYGSRWTYATGLAGMTFFVGVMAFAGDLGWLLAVAPLGGLALALHWGGLQTYVIQAAPPHRRGAASGIISFVLVVAPGLAGLVQGIIADAWGFQAMATLAAILLGLALVGAAIWLPTVPTAPRPGRGPALRSYLRLLRDRPILALALTRSSTTVAFGAFVMLAGPKLVEAGGGLRDVGVLVLAGAVGGAIAQLGIGRLSDAVGRLGVLSAAHVVAAAAALAFGLASGTGALLILFAAYNLASWAFQTLTTALGGDLAPPGSLDQVMALQTSSFSWGMIIGVSASGLLAETAPQVVFALGAASNLAGLALVPLLRRRPPAAEPASIEAA